MILITERLNFLYQNKILVKLKQKITFCINAFCYENKLTFPMYIWDQKFENSMDLLIIMDDSKSHYVYNKGIHRFMFLKTKNKNKKYFCKSCLQCFSSKNVLIYYKEVCLNINGAQTIKFEKRTMKIKNAFN